MNLGEKLIIIQIVTQNKYSCIIVTYINNKIKKTVQNQKMYITLYICIGIFFLFWTIFPFILIEIQKNMYLYIMVYI
jgi:hypothetical protein